MKQNRKFDINKFWRHSFYCALAAKAIAVDLKNGSNELFVAGLVHDIGKLAMYITFPDEFYDAGRNHESYENEIHDLSNRERTSLE